MPKKNINNLPIIKEKSLHRIVDRVKNNDDTLLRDSKTGEYIKTFDYLSVDIDDQKNVTRIYAKQPFYWECWDFGEDIERKDMNKPIKINKKEIYKKRLPEDFIPDKRGENEKNPFVQYDFAIDFSRIEIGSVRSFCDVDNRKIYISDYVRFDECIFLGETNFSRVSFSREAYFKRATFSGEVNFYDVTFYNQAGFDFVIFSSEAGFVGATFSGAVSFYRATFSNEADFGCATFSSITDEIIFGEATFSGETNFDSTIFYNNVYFWRATFSGNVDFSEATFSGNVDFYRVTFFNKVDFTYITFSGGVNMTDLKFTSKELFIDFSNCTIENKIIFGLSEDSADAYKKLIFGLYCSNINYFICDDKALDQIRLYWHDPTKEDDKELGKKTKIERYIHEMRVMRKIFQDLLWGDVADEYYARLMDEQLKLEQYELWRDYPKFLLPKLELFKRIAFYKIDKRLLSKKSNFIKYLKGLLSKKILLTLSILMKKLIFGVSFGWGVRLTNILSTGVVTIFVFSCVYYSQKINYLVGSNGMVKNTQNFFDSLFFSVWTFFNIFLPDFQTIELQSNSVLLSVTTEAILGIIWMTLLVAILARKFMRL